MVILFLMIVFVTYVGIPQLWKKVQIANLNHLCHKRRLMSLTFDDGPSDEITSKLLMLLDMKKVQATFYVLGIKVEKNPSLLQQIQQQGHEIASHSFSHKHAWKQFPHTIIRDIHKGCEALEQAGVRVQSFRPPNGKVTIFSYLYFWMRGLKVGWWTHDSTDTWAETSTIEDIVTSIKNNGGGVVLMHDLNRVAMPDRNQFVLDLTKALIEMAEQEGISVVPQRDLYYEG